MEDLNEIGDTLIDLNVVEQERVRLMLDSFESYKKAVSLLGYFSQLKDYSSEYDNLHDKVYQHRNALLSRYKDMLTERYNHIFKLLLVPPDRTEWYFQGIHKYKKVKQYSAYYYHRQIYVALESSDVDLNKIRNIIQTIVVLDKYYDIYDETIGFFMTTSSNFEELMKKKFPDYVHL